MSGQGGQCTACGHGRDFHGAARACVKCSCVRYAPLVPSLTVTGDVLLLEPPAPRWIHVRRESGPGRGASVIATRTDVLVDGPWVMLMVVRGWAPCHSTAKLDIGGRCPVDGCGRWWNLGAPVSDAAAAR